MWCNKETEEKRKLRYYKEVIDPNIEDENHIYVLASLTNKINIAKIRINSHDLYSET
jgi:hypothetical protein